MNKLFACVFIVAWLGVSAVAAPAMPFSSNRSQGNLVVPVAGGCGIGWHRSPYGGCTRNIYGLFGMGFYYVPHPYYRPVAFLRWSGAMQGPGCPQRVRYLWTMLVGVQLNDARRSDRVAARVT